LPYRYRKDLPLALNKINLEIKGGEKVGVVGRTGAGKTSLVSALLRLTELESGSIRIDDKIIEDMGLNDVRRAIAVIPQDPVLFAGTIRYNLDPFHTHDDEEVWSALEKAHLKAKVKASSGGLSSTVSVDGDNFSVGEKQLICLAR